MSLLDRLPGRQAAAAAAQKLQELDARLTTVSALAESQARTVRKYEEERLLAEASLDQQRGLSGPFVGGKWEAVTGAANSRTTQIEAARAGYDGTWKDNAGVTRPFGTSRRIVDMHAEYCFGGGVEAPTVFPKEGDTEAEVIEQVLRDWWLYPPNQETAFDFESQLRLSSKVLVDGVLFFACFAPTPGRPMLLRLLDPLQMGSPVTAPDDASKVLYHTRKWTNSSWSVKTGAYQPTGAPQLRYYPDIDIESSEDIENPYEAEIGKALAKDKHGNPIRVLQIGDWYSMMLAMMVWEKQFLAIAEDQVTLSAASAKFAQWLTVDGGQTDVDSAAAYYGQTGTNPTTAPGGAADLNVTNPAAKYSFNRGSVGAGEANSTRRMLQMPQAAVGGVSLHYIGDPENANLATASAMEGPQLKHFQTYQGRWTNTYVKLAKEALRGEVDDTRNRKIHIPMPDLLQADLTDKADSLKVAQDAGWMRKEQAAMIFWKALGAADPTAEVETAMADEEEAQEPEAPAVQQPPLPTEAPGANPFAPQ